MSRSVRLLSLMECLRQHRFPVSAPQLSDELSISVRSIYRDIQTLQDQGVAIEHIKGRGYIIRPGFVLPPLMLKEDETEALLLGMRWVVERGDTHLQSAAKAVLSKIENVMPEHLKVWWQENSLIVAPSQAKQGQNDHMALLRQAIRLKLKVHLSYTDLKEKISHRVIWPFVLGFFDHVLMLVGWCEQKNQFRHFRVDRINHINVLTEPYPSSKMDLLKKWCRQEKVDEQRFLQVAFELTKTDTSPD
jgi:predicted DNA-binding transcriptional regulator YafY